MSLGIILVFTFFLGTRTLKKSYSSVDITRGPQNAQRKKIGTLYIKSESVVDHLQLGAVDFGMKKKILHFSKSLLRAESLRSDKGREAARSTP